MALAAEQFFGIIPIVTIGLTYLLVALAEHRMHRINYDFLVVAGGEELIPSLMRRYYQTIYIFMGLALVERLFVQDATSVPWKLLGASMILLGVGFRHWAIRSLGRLWTKRCVFIPGMPHIRSGPYRFVANPEYLSRLLDGIGLCLVLGAVAVIIPYTLFVILMSYRIVKTEVRQIREVSVPEPKTQELVTTA